jgi:ubiquinone/menaquinone biosynthesis C-methylase UbiE
VEISPAGNSGILNQAELNENYYMVADPTDSFGRKTFEKIYISLREKENRLYTDTQVAQLPYIKSSHIHHTEWATRKRSTARLIGYLGKLGKPLAILETGCGNGWLSARLSELPGATVTGTDINELELNQARRVFKNRTNIEFQVGDIHSMVPDKKFDVIVFAASIQYFPSISQTLGRAFSFLKPGGEIHILDSPFYSTSEIADAEQRTKLYYRSIGYDGMIPFYFHHAIESVEIYKYKILFDPGRRLIKLPWRKDPFPWIRIKAS